MVFLIALALIVVAPLSAHVSGKSFFTDMATFQLNRPARLAMFREDRRNIKHDGWGASLQAVVYGSKTTDSCAIASYFLPNNLANSAIAAEPESILYGNRQNDLNAQYFNVATADYFGIANQSYAARLTFFPKKQLIGLGLTYLQRMGRKWWFDVSLPIEQARTTMGMCEQQLQAGGNSPVVTRENTSTTMTAALNNALYFKYGRIFPGWVKSPVRVGDVEIRLGKDLVQTDCAIVGGYLGAVIGTGTKPCAEFVFEPIIGNNRHNGIMFGSYGRFALYENLCGFSVVAVADINSRYLFAANELRSFDLKDRPWSRYFGVWTSETAATTLDDIQPLINFSTLCARVNPRLTTDLNTGLIFERKGWQLELGYNAYARNAEDICLRQNLQSGLGIASIRQFIENADIKTASYSVIQRNTLAGVSANGLTSTNLITDINAANEPIYVALTSADLDLNSAAHPAVFAHAVYANLGYSSSNCRVPCFINGGGAYNFAYDNAALRRWTAFVKVGVTF
ncbi:hypothetical protein M1466_01120 [Candidatus Dependentiae bacterium]|nr:hypothetical protein [Candidatus Dependentiae bacterium]